MATFAIQQKQVCDHAIIIEGQVSTATSTTLTDTKKNWPSNIWIGRQLKIWHGTGLGQIVNVVSNTLNTLTVEPVFDITPDETSLYRGRVFSTIDYCSKCFGTNQYLDHAFSSGRLKLLTDIFKFAQDVETVVLTASGSSIFDRTLGSAISLVLSADTTDDDETLMSIKDSIERAFAYLVLKQSEGQQVLAFQDSELFGQLRDASFTRDPITNLKILLDVISQSGASTAPVTGPLNVH